MTPSSLLLHRIGAMALLHSWVTRGLELLSGG